MTSKILPAVFAATLMLAASCSQGERAVPRPDAFPRLNLPDSAYTWHNAAGKPMLLNRGFTVADSTRERSTWLTLQYPGFSEGKFYLTISREENVENAIANRVERIGLNTGGLPGEQTELTSANGWECLMIHTPGSRTTPVQVLASKGDSMLSGTFYLQLPAGTSPDSVSPVATSACRDMLELLKHL